MYHGGPVWQSNTHVSNDLTKYDKLKQEISKSTEFVHSQLVPEFGLHLITPKMEIWHQPLNSISEKNSYLFSKGDDPYWAIFWPGGQVLCRYILDFPACVKDKIVVDIGSGSGALSIACILAGCKSVISNDIDEQSLGAILLNAEANRIVDKERLKVSQKNYLKGSMSENAEELAAMSDILLIGDMYFDEVIADRISELVQKYISYTCDTNPKGSKIALIGDPGRWYLKEKRRKSAGQLRCIAKYELSDEIKSHNYGLTHGFVYQAIR